MTTAGRFNKILFLKFLGKRVTASKKHPLPNTNFRSFSVKISVKLVCAKTWVTAAEQPTDPRSKDLGYLTFSRL